MNDRIISGDIVNIFWEQIQCEFNVEVLHVPVATGDSWMLKRIDGSIFYVTVFCKMDKV